MLEGCAVTNPQLPIDEIPLALSPGGMMEKLNELIRAVNDLHDRLSALEK